MLRYWSKLRANRPNHKKIALCQMLFISLMLNDESNNKPLWHLLDGKLMCPHSVTFNLTRKLDLSKAQKSGLTAPPGGHSRTDRFPPLLCLNMLSCPVTHDSSLTLVTHRPEPVCCYSPTAEAPAKSQTNIVCRLRSTHTGGNNKKETGVGGKQNSLNVQNLTRNQNANWNKRQLPHSASEYPCAIHAPCLLLKSNSLCAQQKNRSECTKQFSMREIPGWKSHWGIN